MNTEPKWLCRVTKKCGFNERKCLPDDRIIVELVWGHEEKQTGSNDVEQIVIVGTTHHTLKGPTALRSIEAMVEDLNMKGYKPDGKKQVKVRADGFAQNHKQATGLDLFSGIELQRSISYKKTK